MDEDDFADTYEIYEQSVYNGDDLDGGAHDGHYEAEDYYEDTVELEESYDPPGWEDDLYHAWEVE